MVRYCYAVAVAMVLFCVSSCQQIENEAQGVDSKTSKEVQFVIKGITESYGTRATIASVGCTDLWVYEGSTLLKHQVSTDSDFGTPTVSLTYGSHDITFVASKSDGQTFTEKWQCTKVKETFAKAMNVTVSGGSSSSRQVELTRRNSQVGFVIEDAIPEGVKTMHLKVCGYMSLDSALAGGDANSYEASVDVSSRVGKTGFSPTVNVLPSLPAEEEDCAVMIEFLSAEGTVMYHYERTVKVKANRITNLAGNYFAGDSNTLSVKETWEEPLNVAL